MDAENAGSDQRNARGRPFRRGQSGNPKGKPRGVRNRATRLLDKMAETDAADVLSAVISRAKKGDITAAAMILARVWPPRKGRLVNFDLPLLKSATDVAVALGDIAQAIAAGRLSPEEGQTIGAVLEMQRKALELTEFETRIAALEGKQRATT